MKLISLSLLFILSTSFAGCKTWSAFKSDASETAEKTKEHTKDVVEGTQNATRKAVDKMQNAFGTEEE